MVGEQSHIKAKIAKLDELDARGDAILAAMERGEDVTDNNGELRDIKFESKVKGRGEVTKEIGSILVPKSNIAPMTEKEANNWLIKAARLGDSNARRICKKEEISWE